jgi:hypothetical protein
MFPNAVEFVTACRAHAMYHGTDRGMAASLSSDSKLVSLLDADASIMSVPSLAMLPPPSSVAEAAAGGGGSLFSVSHLEDMELSPSEELEHALAPPNVRMAISALLRGAKVRLVFSLR